MLGLTERELLKLQLKPTAGNGRMATNMGKGFFRMLMG